MASNSAPKSPLQNVVPLRSSPRLLAQRRESSNTSPTPTTRLFQRTPTQERAPEEGTLIESVDVLSSEEKKARDLLKNREYMQKYKLSKKGPEKVKVKKNPTAKKRMTSEAAPPKQKKGKNLCLFPRPSMRDYSNCSLREVLVSLARIERSVLVRG